MVWESDLKSAGTKARAVFRASRGCRPPQEPRERARMPSKPSPMMIPWLLFSYRSRLFLGAIILSSVIVGRLLCTNVGEFDFTLSEEAARKARCGKELLALRTALEWFRAHCKRYPTDAEGLRALVRNPEPGVPGWSGYYINQLPPDPWGRPYRYACSNDAPRVWGLGPDGIDGSADDIASPNPDWRALMERVSVRDLPRWQTNAAPAAATSRP